MRTFTTEEIEAAIVKVFSEGRKRGVVVEAITETRLIHLENLADNVADVIFGQLSFRDFTVALGMIEHELLHCVQKGLLRRFRFTDYVELVMRDAPSTSVASTTAVINNHTCPTCKNERCNKSEKTCWRCGNAL